MNYIRPEVVSYGVLKHWRLPENTIIFILIISFFYSKYSRLAKVVSSPIIIFLLIMTLFMWLSGFNALRPDISLKFTGEVFKMIIVAILFVLLTDNHKKLHYLLLANLVGGGFLALWAFQQHFLGNYRLEGVGGGTTDTSNDIAALFVLILPLCLYLVSNKNKIIKYGSLVGSLLLLADIVFTQSRSAFVAFIVIIPYLLIRYKAKKKYIFILLALPLMIYAVTTTSLEGESYIERINRMTEQGMEADKSAYTRKILWSAAWEIFTENPWLGVGQQNFQFNQGKYTESKRLADAHNSYFLVLSEGGIFTFSFYVLAQLFFFMQLSQLRKLAIKDNYMSMQNLVTAIESGMIAFIVCGLAHSYVVFEYYYYWLVFPIILEQVYTHPEDKLLLSKEQSNGLQVD